MQTFDWGGSLELAEALNRNVAQGGITCTIIWNLLFAWDYIFGYADAPKEGEAPYGGQGHGLFYAAEVSGTTTAAALHVNVSHLLPPAPRLSVARRCSRRSLPDLY
jgi:hypothetical protein